jgi:hypothetical protein
MADGPGSNGAASMIILINPDALAATTIPAGSSSSNSAVASVTVRNGYTCGDTTKFAPVANGDLVCTFDTTSATPFTATWSIGACNPIKAR